MSSREKNAPIYHKMKKVTKHHGIFLVAIVIYMSSEIMTSVLGGKRHDSNIVAALEVVAPTVSLAAGLLLLRMGALGKSKQSTREGVIYTLLSLSMLVVRMREQTGDATECGPVEDEDKEHPLLIMGGCIALFGIAVAAAEASA